MYMLATTGYKVRWYAFKTLAAGEVQVEVHDVLDFKENAMGFETKDAAKKAAFAAGLKTWRYVRF